jgi:hypothetical protein
MKFLFPKVNFLEQGQATEGERDKQRDFAPKSMKDPIERTKVVVRHLPPSLTQSDFFPQIDDKFSGRYNWFCFRPGKNRFCFVLFFFFFFFFLFLFLFNYY